MQDIWSNAKLNEWLLKSNENKAIFPDVPVIDPHHHVFPAAQLSHDIFESVRSSSRTQTLLRTFRRAPIFGYTEEDWKRDAEKIQVAATVYVEAHVRYDNAQIFPELGEVLFARKLHEMNPPAFCRGIIARIDLSLPEPDIRQRIESYQAALMNSSCALSGVRFQLAHHRDFLSAPRPSDLSVNCYAGTRLLGTLGIVLDVWLYSHQLDELVALARNASQTLIVCDHIGTPINANPQVFEEWKQKINALAQCENVLVKLGGLGMHVSGIARDTPMNSKDIVETHLPWFQTVYLAFGDDRVMFESNFPMDKSSFSYLSFWNAAKVMAGMLTDNPRSRRKILFENANRIYKLGVANPPLEKYAYGSVSAL